MDLTEARSIRAFVKGWYLWAARGSMRTAALEWRNTSKSAHNRAVWLREALKYRAKWQHYNETL